MAGFRIDQLNNSPPVANASPFRNPTSSKAHGVIHRAASCDEDTAPTGNLFGDAERRIMDTRQIMLVLEQERAKAGMTVQKWADYLDMPLGTYNGWLYGYREPGLERMLTAMDKAGYELVARRKP